MPKHFIKTAEMQHFGDQFDLGFAPPGVPVTGMASHHSDAESCEEVPLTSSFRAPVSCMNFKGVTLCCYILPYVKFCTAV